MLGRDRNHDVNMVGKKMAFLNATLLLLGQSSEHLAQMLARTAIKHLLAAFRGKDNSVLALPFRVA
jgi:ABC-type phosphate/phosphonate transport system permease subunit